MNRWTRGLLVAVALVILGGCASDPRYKMGGTWVEEQESERRLLQAQGFPQYTWY
jgi:hypothetical protein